MRCYKIWSTEEEYYYQQPPRDSRPSRSTWDAKSQAKRIGTQFFGANKFEVVTFKMEKVHED